MDWLSKRLVKVGARVSYHAWRCYVHEASGFLGGITTFSGNLTNETAGSFNVQAQTNFYGNIYNYGYFKVSHNYLAQTGTFFYDSGTYVSDLATSTLGTLNIAATGAL